MKHSYPIFLMGYMTSGKSSLGKKLAKHFDVDFIDLDRYLEKQEQLTISEIFQHKGEAYFREAEAKALRQFPKDQKVVIALGGGTPCHHENINFIKETGTSIYLDIATSTLIGRLREKKAKRPLVANLKDEEISHFVENQISQRTPYYQQADIIISSTSKPKVDSLVKALFLDQN